MNHRPPSGPALPPWTRADRLTLLGLCVVAAVAGLPALGLPLYSGDDWRGLSAGIDLAREGVGALAPLLAGEDGPRGARPVPTLLWALGWSLGGERVAACMYGLALATWLAGGGALYALLRRLTGGTSAAAAGTAMWLFGARVQQIDSLGALDGALAATIVLVSAALWPRARRSGWWALAVGVLVLVGLLTKATTLALVPLLVLLDLAEMGPAGLSWRGLLARYWPAAVGSALGGLHLAGQVRGPLTHGLAWPDLSEVGSGLGEVLVPFAAWGMSAPAVAVDVLRWLLVAVTVVLVSRARAVATRPLLVGLCWTAVTLVVPVLFLLSARMGYLEERHFLLPATGLAVVLAAALSSSGEGGRAARRGAVGFAALSCLGFVLTVTPWLAQTERGTSEALLEALREVSSEQAPPGPGFAWLDFVSDEDAGVVVVVGLATPDPGTLALIDLPALMELAPELHRPPAAFLLGGERLVGPARSAEAGSYPEVEGRFRLAELPWSPATRLLVERLELGPEGPRPTFVSISAVAPNTRSAAGRSWTFPADAAGWSAARLAPLTGEADAVPSALRSTPEGLHLHRSDDDGDRPLLDWTEQPPLSTPPLLVSPEVVLDPAGLCSVEVERIAPPAPRALQRTDLAQTLAGGGCGGALLWSSGSETFAEEPVKIAWLDGPCGAGVVRARLDNHPDWLAGDTVRRFAISPAAGVGWTTVGVVRFVPCGEPSR